MVEPKQKLSYCDRILDRNGNIICQDRMWVSRQTWPTWGQKHGADKILPDFLTRPRLFNLRPGCRTSGSSTSDVPRSSALACSKGNGYGPPSSQRPTPTRELLVAVVICMANESATNTAVFYSHNLQYLAVASRISQCEIDLWHLHS